MVGVADRCVTLLQLLGSMVVLASLLLGQPPARASEPERASESASEPAEPGDSRLRLVWQPASVAWPLTPLTGAQPPALGLSQRVALLEGREIAPSVRGVVELDSDRAVGVWIAALETVRVRSLDAGPPPRFVRVVDENAAVVEPRRPARCSRSSAPGGCWELQQPPSTGGLWSIEADEPTRVLIERVAPRSPRYVAVEVEFELLEWIADGLGFADLPSLLGPADDLRGRIHYDAALGRELVRVGGSDRRLLRAIEAWRMLSVMAELDRERPAVRPYFAREHEVNRPLSLAETREVELAVDDSRRYRLAAQPQRWRIDHKGPGQLRIAARAWAASGQSLRDAELRVHAGGRVIERIRLRPRQARLARDPDTAIPQLIPLTTKDGDPVGELVQRTLVLTPGRHDYELELVGGPALLTLESARRIEATAATIRGWTPRRRTRAAERALERSDSPASEWLELLLLERTHAPLAISAADSRFDELGRSSPLLASSCLAIAAAADEIDADTLAQLVARVIPWLTALDRDPDVAADVRGQVRARWIELAAAHARPDLAAALVREDTLARNDPIAELPVGALRTLAALLGPTRARERSPALALLELARRRTPADSELRSEFLYLWATSSRWSRGRPLPIGAATRFEDDEFEPVGEWLVAHSDASSRAMARNDGFLRLEPGAPARIRIEVDDDVKPGRRKRLIDVHVATPVDAVEPVLLRVDERRWWSPQLASLQRHRLALGPGEHELEIVGPPGTIAWAGSLATVERPELAPEQLGRRERMWPLARSVWKLPGPPVPGFVRLELRWPEDVPARPVRIRVIEDGEEQHGTRSVLFDPRTSVAATDEGVSPKIAIDHSAMPVADSAWASTRHDVTLAIAAGTTALRFEVEDDLEIAAAVSVRRGVTNDDLEPMGAEALSSADEIAALLGPLPGLDRGEMLTQIAADSRELLARPDQLDARARRAALLLLLGETGHARADLVWMSAYSDRTLVPIDRRERALALLAELEQRFEALTDPREIVVDDPKRVATPELIEPAIAAVVGDDRALLDAWTQRWSMVRAVDPDAALEDIARELASLRDQRARETDASELADIDRSLMLGSLTRAHLLSRDHARARDAGREWLRLYGRSPGALTRAREPIAIGLAAVVPLLTYLDDPTSDARDAGLAFGLARELEPVYGHASVRRLAFVAALRSGWSRLGHSEDNAGFERLELPVTELMPTPAAEIRDALLVAPWPAGEAEQLMPGRRGVLAWDASVGSVTAEFWCRVTRPDLAPGRAAVADRPDTLGSAHLRLRLRGDQHDAQPLELDLGDAERGVVELALERDGRHQLEVELADDPIWSCSWRAMTRPANAKRDANVPIEPRRRAQWWTAEPDHGVELIVLGPASLQIGVRGVASNDPARRPQHVIAEIEPLNVGDAVPPEHPRVRSDSLELAREVEAAVVTEDRRRFEVATTTGHTLLLTEPVPYHVRLTSDRGRVLIRARLRRDRGDLPPPARVSIHELLPPESEPLEPPSWRSGGPSAPILASDLPEPVRNQIGTLELRARVGLDEIADVDDLRPRLGLVASVGWRRALIERRLWLGIAAETRLRDQSRPAGGGSLRIGARLPPITGVRLGAELNALAQPFANHAATSVRLYGFIDRPVWLGPYVQLRPGLTAGLRWQSLTPEEVSNANAVLEPQPRIYQRYIHDHPVLLRPELALRIHPLQDMAVWSEAQLVPNSDFRSVDHVNIELGTIGVARRPRPWVPTWGLSYQASLRFVDANRSTAFVRHRLETDLGLGFWAGDTARVAFGVSNQLYASAIAPIRDVFELWVRVDASFGRRMRDYGPREQWYREPWAPQAWDDDEHQARSTYTPARR